MSSEVVKYHNDLNKIKFIGFNEKELNVFFSLVFLAKEQGIRELTIPFSELRILSNNDKGKHRKRFIDILNSLNKKLVSLHQQMKVGNKTYTFTLFNTFIVDEDNDNLSVEVNKIFSYMLNDLVGEFTKFELIDLVSLKSSYSKTLFTLLKQWSNLKNKEKKFTLDEFKQLLGVKGNYERFSSFDTHVLGQLRKDLTGVIPNFKLKLEKTGRQYTHIIITWGAGKVDNEVINYVEDDTKEIEISSKTLKKIKEICKHNRFIKEVLDDEENLTKLVEKFENNQEALIKGLEYASKKIASLSLKNNTLNINLEYLIKAVRTGAGIKRVKKILKIVQDDVIDVTAEDIKNDNVRQTTFDELQPQPIEKKEDEKINNDLFEFNKLSDEEQAKIEKTALELLIKELGKDGKYIGAMKNTSPTMYYNSLKKYIIQAMNGEEVLAEEKVEEQPIQVKEEKKVYTADDIPEEKLIGKNGKKLVGGALQMRIKKILKEMNEE